MRREEQERKANRIMTASAIFFTVLSALFMLTVQSASASSTQQTNTIKMTPYYFSSLPQNTNQTMYAYVDIPAMNKVFSALFHFKIYTGGATTTYTLFVDDNLCGTYLVSTSYANAGQSEISFDCTTLMQNQGNHIVKMKSSVNAGSFFGWLDMTYEQNPFTISSGGTEYILNDPARVFVRLLDGNSRPISGASCNTTIYYPNNTKFKSDQLLTLLEKGIYYYDFTVPNTTGNYITIFDCLFPSLPFTQNISLMATLTASGITSVSGSFAFDDSDNMTINSAFMNVSWTGTSAQASADVYFNGFLLGSISGTSGLARFNLNQSNFVIGEEQSYQVQRTGGIPTIQWVYLYVNYTYNGQSQIIRGQNEVHVTDIHNPIFYKINNLSYDMNSNFTYTNSLITNSTGNLTGALNGLDASMKNNFTYTNNLLLAVNSSIFVKLYKIQDEITSVNDTIKGIYMNLDSALNGNFTYTNSIITNMNVSIHQSIQDLSDSLDSKYLSLMTAINNLQTDMQAKYDNLVSLIYALEQKWIDDLNTIISQLAGGSDTLNRIGGSLGITSSEECAWWDKVVGRC